MRPAIYLKRPQGAPTAVEFLSIPPDQCVLSLGPQSVMVLFGGKEIHIEGNYGAAILECSASLQDYTAEDAVHAINERLKSLLIPRAERIYQLAESRKDLGQLTCVHENLTLGHAKTVWDADNILVLPLNVPTKEKALEMILDFLTEHSVRRYL
jgi:hypothetical protein